MIGSYRLVIWVILSFVKNAFVLENDLARTPPMGWMSWGYYACADKCVNPDKCLNEELIMTIADYFYEEGYQEAGYEYIIIDDCWSEKHRDRNGRLQPDKRRFPRGMKFLANYIHARGLKFGMYTNVADITCMGYPGSRDHFKIDAATFASWEIDYLKVDGCFTPEDNLNEAYISLGRYLNKTGRPILYSCSWPYYIQFIHKKTFNYSLITPYCNMWRNYHDVNHRWDSVSTIIRYYYLMYDRFSPYHGPGHWNDPDMLVLGNNVLTESQARIQLVSFSMMSAPLLLSCDMKRITTYEKSLLQNLDLIAIAQDALGIMAEPYPFTNDLIFWVKPHLPMKGDQYHSYSFALVNFSNESDVFSFVPGGYGLNSTDGYAVMDVFSRKYFLNVTVFDTVEMPVNGQDVSLYTFFPL